MNGPDVDKDRQIEAKGKESAKLIVVLYWTNSPSSCLALFSLKGQAKAVKVTFTFCLFDDDFGRFEDA